MRTVNRRRFVQGGVSSLFVANALSASAAGAPALVRPAWDYVFFDGRFAAARRLAEQMSGITAPTPVQGDITAIWTRELAHASLVAPLTMAGVTTESVYFCLKILLADRASVDAQVSRLDRDLHLWTLRTHNHTRNRATSWQNRYRPA
jgi:hypothetical protein